MHFTENERLKLCQYGFGGNGKLIIKGISGMGNPFTTSGIVSDYEGQLDISDNTIILNLSYNPTYVYGLDEKTRITAPFLTTLEDFVIKSINEKRQYVLDGVKRTLFVKSIEDEKGNVIFDNKEDFDKVIVPIIMKMKKDRKEKLSSTFRYMDGSIDNVSAVVQEMTAKPVIIDGVSYVPAGIEEFDENGRPVGVDASFKTSEYKIPINENSKISVFKDNETYFTEVATNEGTDNKDLFEERKNLIHYFKENEK